LILVGGPSLAHDILPEARALLDAEEASDTPGHSTNHAANNSTHRSSRRSAFFSATLSATNYALCLSSNRQCENCD
jgi:hypothetical protein